jgi:hypothetical protein
MGYMGYMGAGRAFGLNSFTRQAVASGRTLTVPWFVRLCPMPAAVRASPRVPAAVGCGATGDLTVFCHSA